MEDKLNAQNIEDKIDAKARLELEENQLRENTQKQKEQLRKSYINIEHLADIDILHISRGNIIAYFFKYYLWMLIPTIILLAFPLFGIALQVPVFWFAVTILPIILLFLLICIYLAYTKTRPLTLKIFKGEKEPVFIFFHKNENKPLCIGKWKEFSIYYAKVSIVGGTRFRHHDFSYEGIAFAQKDWIKIEAFEDRLEKKYFSKKDEINTNDNDDDFLDDSELDFD